MRACCLSGVDVVPPKTLATVCAYALLLITLPGSLLSADAVRDAHQAELAKIRSDWQERLRRTRTFRYRVEGSCTLPKGSILPDEGGKPGGKVAQERLPPRDVAYPTKLMWAVDVTNSLFRTEVDRKSYYIERQVLVPDTYTFVFDGSSCRVWRPKTEEANNNAADGTDTVDVWVEPDDITVFYVTANDYPILFAHGLFPLSGRFDPHRLKDVSVEQLAFQSLGSAVVNGNRCVVLRASPVKGQSDSYDEFWIDPNRESSVVRWFRYVNQGKVFARLDIESVETSDGWLPRSWSTCFYHTPAGMEQGDLESHSDNVVTEASVNLDLSRSEFQIHPSPGMIVRDNIQKQGYQLGDEGQKLSVSAKEHRRPVRRNVLIVTTGLMLLCAVVLAMYRMRKRARARMG